MPPVSLITAGTRLNVRAGVSLSTTVTVAVLLKLLVVAVIVTLRLPSAMVSSTAVTGKVAEVAPAGIVTVAGTVVAPVLLLERLTTRSLVRAKLRVIVPVATPPASLIAPGLIVTARAGESLSTTFTVVLLVKLPAVAVTVTVALPLAIVSSTGVTVNWAELDPAGMVMLSGNLRRLGLLEVKVTTIA